MERTTDKKVEIKLEHPHVHPLLKVVISSAVTFGSMYGFSEISRILLDEDGQKKAPGKYAGRR